MKTFLTFDISISNTGWGSGDMTREPRCGSFPLDIESQRLGPLLNKFSRCARDLIALENPDVIVVEAAFIQGKNETVAFALICLVGELQRVADEVGGIRVMLVHNRTLKTWFTGDQYATKGQMIERCIAFGWDPKNNDEADGLALWAYGVNKLYPMAISDRLYQADMGGVR